MAEDGMNRGHALVCRESGAVANDVAGRTERRQQEDAIISEAIAILRRRTSKVNYGRADSPSAVKNHLMLCYGEAEKEYFGVLWLDVKNRILAREILSTGTLTHCSVYPREIVKGGLRLNAASCILFHNHPSGVTDPSDADQRLTDAIKTALALVDMRVLDHIVVAGADTCSFAEQGLL
jgi:DNA repair protein RadC